MGSAVASRKGEIIWSAAGNRKDSQARKKSRSMKESKTVIPTRCEKQAEFGLRALSGQHHTWLKNAM